MKSAIYRGRRQLEIGERSLPKILPGEVLLEVRRVGICGTDLKIFQGEMEDRARPGRILGHEMVGIVRQARAGGAFDPGDRVVVEPTMFCGDCPACRRGQSHVCQHLRLLGIDEDGAFQEFCAVPEHRLHAVADSLMDDHAAMVEPLAVAVHAVRLSALRENEMAAVVGGGTLGLLIAVLARKTGAKVVVLEINPYRLQFARRLGFEAFDPRTKETTGFIADIARESGMNVVFEASGSAEGARMATSLAAVQGRVLVVGIHGRATPMDLFQVFFRELSVQGVRAYASQDFKEAIRLAEGCEVDLAPFISKHYPLEKLQEAMESAIGGAPGMKVLIDVAGGVTESTSQ